jgi:hypothetical protein
MLVRANRTTSAPPFAASGMCRLRPVVVFDLVSMLPKPRIAVGSKLLVFGPCKAEKASALFARAAKAAGVHAAFYGERPQLGQIRAVNYAATMLPRPDRGALESFLSWTRSLMLALMWRKPHSLVMQEALARGVPVIDSSGTGTAKLVHNRVNGLLFARGNKDGPRQRLGEQRK